jgi:tRNA nucleotidyltransferase (CCA-adding enzyme)
MFLAGLPDAARDLLRRIVESGAGSGGVYLAGGVPRDLIIGRPVGDIDLATEGDAINLLAHAAPGLVLTAHTPFRTASVTVGGVRVDIATTRREIYVRPGALPTVAMPASIDEDLRRRDFTVNALAIRLDGPAALLDPGGGQQDIASGVIRVLHDASFRDDPTRIYRAFRFAARLGFRIEEHSLRLLAAALPDVAAVTGERLRRELELTFGEATGGAALQAAFGAGALEAIAPGLQWDPRFTAALAGGAPSGATAEEFGFALMGALATPDQARHICTRLALRRDEAAAVTDIDNLRNAAPVLVRLEAKPSGVAIVLDRFRPAAIAAYAAASVEPMVSDVCLRYLEEWRRVAPLLNGHDVEALGVPPGPQIGKALQLIRAARLDGWASDRDDERALALRFAKSTQDAAVGQRPIDLNGNAD